MTAFEGHLSKFSYSPTTIGAGYDRFQVPLVLEQFFDVGRL